MDSTFSAYFWCRIFELRSPILGVRCCVEPYLVEKCICMGNGFAMRESDNLHRLTAFARR